MSEIKQLTITLQGSEAACLRFSRVVSNQIKKGYLHNLPVKKINVGEYLAKLQASICSGY